METWAATTFSRLTIRRRILARPKAFKKEIRAEGETSATAVSQGLLGQRLHLFAWTHSAVASPKLVALSRNGGLSKMATFPDIAKPNGKTLPPYANSLILLKRL